MVKIITVLAGTLSLIGVAEAQGDPTVSQVIMRSFLTSQPIQQSLQPGGTFTPAINGKVVTGAVRGLLSVYTGTTNDINNPTIYNVANTAALSTALGANIAVALSVIPLTSPTSGVILKEDPTTGASLPVSSTLGPIFTQRAETIGKGKYYIGVTHQNYHFTSLNGQKLNGVSVLYSGGDVSGITLNNQSNTTAPATVNLGLDVRLSQDIAFLTYGATNHFDISLGLPMVHAAVASRAYNGVIYSGNGTDFNRGNKCWCVNTFAPGSFDLTAPEIGQASLGKTGFGDVVVRLKGTLLERSNAVLAIGGDLRFPTGDAMNYLGTGTTSVKPFVALSLYSKPLFNNVIFSPHVDAGWQFSGKSVLAGTLTATRKQDTSLGFTVPVDVDPFTSSKDYLPDVFSWGLGTEIAIGTRNTVVLDILGNQIGWIHGVQALNDRRISDTKGCSANGCNPPPGAVQSMTSGFSDAGHSSFGQYSGAFGYKVRVAGNLVASFQALVRFDNNGLTARVVPLYGLGYSF